VRSKLDIFKGLDPIFHRRSDHSVVSDEGKYRRHCPRHERYTHSPTTLTYRPPEGLRQLYEDRNHAVDKELNRLRKADQRVLAKWKKGALETVKVNCEVRGPDGTWHYGSKTDDVPTSSHQSVVLADGTNLAQVASDDNRALTLMYIGTKIEALNDETKQWQAAVVISVVPNTGCVAPCSSTTVMVAFLDAGTATFKGVANLKPGNTLPCRCFNKIGCFDRDSCTCYIGNKDEDTFCVKTGDASLGGYCESCDAHKKERFTQVNHDNRNCARCIKAFNECRCLDLEPLRQLKEVDPSAHRTTLFEILAVSEMNFQKFSKRSAAARDAMKEKRLKFVNYFGAEAKLMLAEKGVPDWQLQQTYSLALTQFQKMNDLRNPTRPRDTNIPKNLVWYELAIDSLLYDMDPLNLLFDRAMRLRLHVWRSGLSNRTEEGEEVETAQNGADVCLAWGMCTPTRPTAARRMYSVTTGG